ncbi:cytochrome oxidase assembly [Anaeromyxobacter dehalogenans 2CP-1]|uniref:Cytochrome oxidase assembly n=1 Tax=Anaeromyxobacter dehalogenans (strain ATCC BAA-258 / DSM 21875 / 2CP-1) TaxID=455488 RepID=B8J8Y5_ANAD2|nr:COX15/CtaA family protein [Anaeromyxobacter dehalogenans]ACL63583.1 cytochrome oxidase assembly [Anaeromyxobacter dehalogenans 2CP-1]
MKAFARFAWSVLAYNLAVVVWGAFVRATGSGAGCGKHWPMCNGEVVPRSPALETVIEFTHRATSGVALLLVVALVVAARRTFPPGHPARRWAWASLGLVLVEALVGAGLVLFGWVAKDDSAARGWVVAVHLTNTFLLVGAIALTAALAGRARGLALRGHAGLTGALGLAAGALVLTGASGAIAALGDTLFPATSFAEGLRQELSEEAHVLLRLRVLHPFVAVFSTLALGWAARSALRARPDADTRAASFAVLLLAGLQLFAGVLNVALLAPVWMQLVHLLVADLLWVALVVLAATALSPPAGAASPAGARPGDAPALG